MDDDELDREAVEKTLSVLDKEIDLSHKKTTTTCKKTTPTRKKTTATHKKTTASPPQTQAQAQEAQASLAPPQKRHGQLPTLRRYRDIVPAIADAMQVQSVILNTIAHKILPPAPTLESSGPILATVTPSNTPYIDRPVAPPGAGSLTLPHMFPLEPSSATELPPIPISRVPGTSVTAALAVARSAKFTEFYAYEADGNRNLHKRKQQKGLKEAKEPKKSKKAQKVTSKPEHTERLQQLQGDK
ncbi:hypothetical protein BG005_004546 [Podila minutissima]|nr:hypothetical protein BG005_004546 [Podila minutissima]